jgi:hypothetical protein
VTDIAGCFKCKTKLGNDGILHLYRRTESDEGGYYPALVRCEQCGKTGPGRASSERAITAWNKTQREAREMRSRTVPASTGGLTSAYWLHTEGLTQLDRGN